MQKRNAGPAIIEAEEEMSLSTLKTTSLKTQASVNHFMEPGCHSGGMANIHRVPACLNTYNTRLLYANLENGDINEIAEYDHCRDGNLRRAMDGSIIVNLQSREQLYVYKGEFSGTPEESYKIFPEYDLLSNTGLPLQPHNVSHVVRSYTRKPGYKNYEFTDHLGNIRVTYSDKKINPGSGSELALDVLSRADYYPFGMTISNHTSNPQEYRFGFNGMESDNEIADDKNIYTAAFWQYDSRIGRRWNLDPKPNPAISQYATFANNPIFYSDPLGDTIVVDNKGYTTRVDRDEEGNLVDNFVFTTNKDGSLKALGELTKDVDANEWFTNLLEDNSKEADGIWNPFVFRDNVAKDGKWDYKNLNTGNEKLGIDGRKEHILGIAFSLDKDTDFSFEGETYRSEDLNNFHFGVVGKATGLFPAKTMLKQAGAAEIGKWKDLGKEVPASWKPTKTVVRCNRFGCYEVDKLQPPYGDNPIDHEMIKRGFQYYKENRKSLDGDLW